MKYYNMNPLKKDLKINIRKISSVFVLVQNQNLEIKTCPMALVQLCSASAVSNPNRNSFSDATYTSKV